MCSSQLYLQVSCSHRLIQVPLLQFLEADPNSTAIFVYPTKVRMSHSSQGTYSHSRTQALAQDQRAALEQLLYSCPGLEDVKVSTYDGDTPQELRAGTSLVNEMWRNSPCMKEFVRVAP